MPKDSRLMTVPIRVLETGLINEASMCDDKGLKELVDYAKCFAEESYQRRVAARKEKEAAKQ